MITILAATGNQHKLREIRKILAPHNIIVKGGNDVGGIPSVIEDGSTFQENAIKKAVEVATACNCLTMADDSGLEVFALDDKPGVYSARFAGEKATDEDNVTKLLHSLRGKTNTKARFRCVVAVADSRGLVGTAAGEVQGEIIAEPRGNGGFGYDPVFVPNGYRQTFAELTPEIKNQLSHRAAALQAAIDMGLFHSRVISS